MRFKVLMKVDFPQPDGPINAVTVPVKKSNEISSSTCFLPNQAWMPRASKPVEKVFGVPTFESLALVTSDKEFDEIGLLLAPLFCEALSGFPVT
jgi:hypothetical protein